MPKRHRIPALYWIACVTLAIAFTSLLAPISLRAIDGAPYLSPASVGVDPLTDIATFSAGEQHTCAVTSDGRVQCWGRNSSGQLGNGSTADSALPITVPGLSDVVAVSASGFHTCARTEAGAVLCWGNNFYGQLGDGTNDDSPSPVAVVGLESGVAAISAGGSHTCALTDGGAVKCWGDNSAGAVGDGTGDDRNSPVDVDGLTSGVAAISSGGGHTCALTDAGGLKCWGWNFRGQLGDNSEISRSSPVDVAGLSTGVTAVSSGAQHTCALLEEGGVQCWGRNAENQLGDGTENGSLVPVDADGTEDAAGIHAGGFHTCITNADGGIQCWGWNEDGQLGDDSTTDAGAPVDVVGLASGVDEVSLGEEHSCARIEDGIQCWGNNNRGQLGDNTDDSRLTPVDVLQGGDVLAGISALGAGSTHSCAVTNSGGILCWGGNDFGQLGDGSTVTSTVAVEHSTLTSGIAAVGAGEDHTCALTDGGGVKCWGRNSQGQLGNGKLVNSSEPVDALLLSQGVSSLTTGGNHSCVLLDTGGIRCWGANGTGQLGNGSRSASTVAQSVTGLTSGVINVSAGSSHTCAVTSSGAVKCWGWNFYGQVGDGSTDFRTEPVDVVGLGAGAAAVVAGRWHTCAIMDDGRVKCWGYNVYGQLGDGTEDDSPTPVDVVNLPSAVTQVTVGDSHTCALTESDGILCWGLSSSGRLGGDPDPDFAAVVGLGTGVTQIAGGDDHTCALIGGNVRCWGDNEFSQIGDGNVADRDEPAPVLRAAVQQSPAPSSDSLYLPTLLRSAD
nr:hypothetical protein [uncultured bacterium]